MAPATEIVLGPRRHDPSRGCPQSCLAPPRVPAPWPQRDQKEQVWTIPRKGDGTLGPPAYGRDQNDERAARTREYSHGKGGMPKPTVLALRTPPRAVSIPVGRSKKLGEVHV